MSDLKFDISLLSATTLLAVIIAVFPAALIISPVFFLLMVCLLGIPHGALDHIFYFRRSGKGGSIWFYVTYLALFALTGICWYFFPTASFLIFLIISAYHFGQSQLFHIEKLSAWFKHAVFLSWGAFLLSFIVYSNLEECIQIFRSLEWLDMGLFSHSSYWATAVIISFTFLIFSLLYAALRGWITVKKLLIEFAVLVILSFIALTSNAVFTFAVYFGIWHSLRSLVIEYESLSADGNTANLRSFLVRVIPFSLIAIGFLFAANYLLPFYTGSISPYMVFIIIISMLTVPHLIVMYDLYEKYA